MIKPTPFVYRKEIIEKTDLVFKQFSEWFGWYINTPIYMLAVSLGAYLLFVLNYWSLNKNLPHMKKRHASKR